MDISDMRNRAVAFRQHLRNKVSRLCSRLIRDTHGGKRQLTDEAAYTQMSDLHSAGTYLQEFTLAFIQDHNLYTEDGHHVSESMKSAFAAYTAAHGVGRTLELQKKIEAKKRKEAEPV